MKHLLKMLDLSTEEIIEILDLADQLKYELKHGIPHPHLKGKSLGMIFQKASTRTRVSFETGMYQLGGHPLFLSANDLQIGRGEPVQDTARVLSRYLDGIMIRTFEQKEVEDLAEYGSIPIINGLTDFCHPCQILADLMTIREFKSSFDGLKMCFIGDGNNMANSLIVGCLKVGMSVSIACPNDYQPDQEVLDFAAQYGNKFQMTDKPLEAAAGIGCQYGTGCSLSGSGTEKPWQSEDAVAGISGSSVLHDGHHRAGNFRCQPAAYQSVYLRFHRRSMRCTDDLDFPFGSNGDRRNRYLRHSAAPEPAGSVYRFHAGGNGRGIPAHMDLWL